MPKDKLSENKTSLTEFIFHDLWKKIKVPLRKKWQASLEVYKVVFS